MLHRHGEFNNLMQRIMKKTYRILFTLFIANISAIAQNNYAGKYYVAQISASCKEMVNGGCMVYKYCILKFDKDSVEVSSPTKAYCTPIRLEYTYNSKNNLTKRYEWKVVSNKLMINDFEDFGKYSFKEQNENYVMTLYSKPIDSLNNNNGTLILKGIVKDEKTYEFLPTAKITLKKNSLNTNSDFDGKFSIKVENYRLLKFPDTLQISFPGYPLYKIEIKSIEELEKIFKLSSSVSLSQINSNNEAEEITYPVFFIQTPGNPYPVVPYRKNKKRKQK